MSDYLTSLLTRSLSIEPSVEPRLPSRFEPISFLPEVEQNRDAGNGGGLLEEQPEQALPEIDAPAFGKAEIALQQAKGARNAIARPTVSGAEQLPAIQRPKTQPSENAAAPFLVSHTVAQPPEDEGAQFPALERPEILPLEDAQENSNEDLPYLHPHVSGPSGVVGTREQQTEVYTQKETHNTHTIPQPALTAGQTPDQHQTVRTAPTVHTRMRTDWQLGEPAGKPSSRAGQNTIVPPTVKEEIRPFLVRSTISNTDMEPLERESIREEGQHMNYLSPSGHPSGRSMIQPYLAPLPDRPHDRRDKPGPAIHIKIGRIEVRAVPEKEIKTSRARKTLPKMSLDDYLRLRDKGGRS